MNNFKRLGKNTFLVFLGSAGSKLIGFLMIPFYTKWLSVQEFGTSDNIIIYVSLILTIVTLSISDAIFIFPKDQYKEKQKEYLTSGFLYSIILLIVTGGVLYIIKEILIFFDMLLSVVSNIIFIYLLIVAYFFQTFFQQFSQSLGKIRVYAVTGIVLTLSTAFFSFILIPKYGLKGFFTAQIFSFLIAAIYSVIGSGSYKYFSRKSIRLNRYSEMIKYSVPLIPNAIMWWLVASLNRPLMEEYIGIYAIGIYAVANKIPSLINVLFSVFMVSWQISVIEEYKNADFEKFYNKVLKSVFTFLTLIVIILSVFGRPVIQFIIDPKFMEAYKYIPILCFSVLFSSVSNFVGANFSASRKSKYFFYSSIFGAVVALIFNFLLIPVFGLYGVVFAILLSHFAMMLARVVYSWRMVKIKDVMYYIFLLLICFSIVLSLTFIHETRVCVSIVLLGLVLFIFLAIKEFIKELMILKNSLNKEKISN